MNNVSSNHSASTNIVITSVLLLKYGDYHTYLSSSEALSEYEARTLTYQLAQGLSYMHKNGFLYRDLKPNVSL
jgi:serine/threonine protein kinase